MWGVQWSLSEQSQMQGDGSEEIDEYDSE